MTTRPETDAAHSRFGPSSADQWIACPGSIQEMERVPAEARNTSNRWAEQGSAAHALAEVCVVNDVSPGVYRGQWINRHGVLAGGALDGTFFEVDDDMVEGVELYRQTIKQYRARLSTPTPPEVYVEQRVYFLPGRPDVFGTSDCIMVQPFKRLVTFDFKYGLGLVEVEGNDQLRLYAAGALNWLGDDGFVEDVEVVVVQPRAEHEDGPVRSSVMTVEEVRGLAAVARGAVEAAEGPNPPLVSGPHCKWCKARGVCRKLKAEADEMVGADWSGELAKAPAQMTGEELAEALEKWNRLKALGSAIQEVALQYTLGGGTLPGWKLVRGKKHRTWKNVLALEEGLKDAGIPDAEAYQEPKIKSPAQMEKMMGKEWVAQYSFTPEGGPTLVPESDARPSISAGLDADLQALALID